MSKRYKGKQRAWNCRALIRRDGCVSGMCGLAIASMREVTIDHIIPLSKGGSETLENMQLAHEGCNQVKADLSPEEWKELQGG